MSATLGPMNPIAFMEVTAATRSAVRGALATDPVSISQPPVRRSDEIEAREQETPCPHHPDPRAGYSVPANAKRAYP
jgi:hypothetical protein